MFVDIGWVGTEVADRMMGGMEIVVGKIADCIALDCISSSTIAVRVTLTISVTFCGGRGCIAQAGIPGRRKRSMKIIPFHCGVRADRSRGIFLQGRPT
jgi:hypothetical protein